ncbi:hypothetical protein D910_00074 [Dendroctonus ponderosae]
MGKLNQNRNDSNCKDFWCHSSLHGT